MKHWKSKIKAWLIHKLGGYTADEATPNRKIERLQMYHRYPQDMLAKSQSDTHLRERRNAVSKFLEGLEPYLCVNQRRDYETGDWILRLSLRVIDEDLL